MLAPPSLKHVLHYPVTAGVAVAALAVTGMWWSGQDIDGFVTNVRVWSDWELWRALTSTLPHVNLFHLAFNLYWLWTFGTLVEREYGHFKCAAIYVLLAFSSSLAEFSLLDGGVGLSGVGYGLWALLWVLERRDPRFAGAVDYQTSRLFVFWFFLCIVLTVANIMPVANIAHGVGAVVGALLGLAVSGRGRTRWQSAVGLVAAVMLCLAGATVFWPWINLSPRAEPEVENAGLDAMDRNDNATAARLLEIAVRMRQAPARAWYNLGVARQRLKQYDAALAAYTRAADMPEATSEMERAAQAMKDRLSGRGFALWSAMDETNAGPAALGRNTNR